MHFAVFMPLVFDCAFVAISGTCDQTADINQSGIAQHNQRKQGNVCNSSQGISINAQ